jgi:hypothetical protein
MVSPLSTESPTPGELISNRLASSLSDIHNSLTTQKQKRRAKQFGYELKYIVSVHRTLKLEIRNWKFGLHAFILLMNVFNFGPSFLTIALIFAAMLSDDRII